MKNRFSDTIVKTLLNHESEGIASPIEKILIDRLRFDSDYMTDLENSVREDFEKETILKILKEKNMLQKLRDEIQEEALDSLENIF